MAALLNCINAGFSYSPSTRPLLGHVQSSSSCSVKPINGKRGMTIRAEAINPEIRKSEEKVVDSVVVSELAKPLTAYCRCWRSGTFPLCDGSHVKHNKATGDNVGPLLLKKPKE
ncbi:hypothetical protein Sjap_020771 [Stephania japonica]|uniref:Iron-binding zinc finger CDGSH type domain-containing protein n=1 Tax=Stephania japonica TaxID=461633 RepID=A0AAP0F6V7_9MAGN